MGALLVIAALAALGAASVLRGYLTADDQFIFVFIALGALALLFVVAAWVSAICDVPVSWRRLVGRS